MLEKLTCFLELTFQLNYSFYRESRTCIVYTYLRRDFVKKIEFICLEIDALLRDENVGDSSSNKKEVNVYCHNAGSITFISILFRIKLCVIVIYMFEFLSIGLLSRRTHR